MPLTRKGASVMGSMMETYKDPKKAKKVFYSMVNSGKLKGAHKKKIKRKSMMG